ncbi:hypothetical protein BYT27DRAFT_7227039 [Phlegmacium glaucopus]|nr:hypothetical protein BYT27DRAFT_7227039 [Phlegmacium glaucopus]
MEVREATLESHTGVWIKSFVLEVCCSRICAIVSDSTGNTPLHPELLVQEIPTMFNPPDITLSNFHTSINLHIMRGVITKFHKSHLGEAELKIAHVLCGIGKGLVSIGKTCFGTIIIAACFEFEFALAQLIKLGLPALKASTCLEANEATVGDIYIFWHAMMWSIKEMLLDPLLEFPENVQEQVLGILNSRHSQIFGDGNLATSVDLYLCGAYLNPGIHFFTFLCNELCPNLSC